MKESDGNFFGCWGGIASLQLTLSAVWTGARMRGIEPEMIVKWMSESPGRLAGFSGQKGAIAAGYDADITIWNSNAEFRVGESSLEHRHPLTPYNGRTLQGRVEKTLIAGEIVFGE